MPLIKAKREYPPKKDAEGNAIKRMPSFVKCDTRLFNNPNVAAVAKLVSESPKAGAMLTLGGVQLASVLELPAVELLVTAAILKFWSAVSQEKQGGGDDWHWTGRTIAHIESTTGVPGLGRALESVGWVEQTANGVRLPNYARFNHLSAKPEAERKRRQRESEKLAKTGQTSERDMSREIVGHVTPKTVTCHDKTGTSNTGTGVNGYPSTKATNKKTTTDEKTEQDSQQAEPAVVVEEKKPEAEQPNSPVVSSSSVSPFPHQPTKGAKRPVAPQALRPPRSVDELSETERHEFLLFCDLHLQLVVPNDSSATRLFPDNSQSLSTFLALLRNFQSAYVAEQRNYFNTPLPAGATESPVAAHLRSIVGDVVAFSAAIVADTPVREYLCKFFAVIARAHTDPDFKSADYLRRTPFSALCRSADTVSICLSRTDVQPVAIEHQAPPSTM